MCMWQSQAFCGAAPFGASVPVEFDTCWARPCRPIIAAVAAIATMEAFLMNARRSFTLRFMSDLPDSAKDGAPLSDRQDADLGSRDFGYHFPQGGNHEKNAQRPARGVAQRQQERAGQVPGGSGFRSKQAGDRAGMKGSQQT